MHTELVVALVLIVAMLCQRFFTGDYGNPVSEHAEIHLDLSGIGGLLAMSRRRYVNVIAAVHFRADFGSERIFSLASSFDKSKAEKHKVADSYQGSPLFGEDVTYSELVNKIVQGNELKSTTLTEEYDWVKYQSEYTGAGLPLFEIDRKGRVIPFTVDNDLSPSVGSIVIALETGKSNELQSSKGD